MLPISTSCDLIISPLHYGTTPPHPTPYSLIVSTLWPLAVSFALLFIAPLYSVLRGGSYWAASAAYLSPVLTISFLVFISTCTKILSFFKCDEFADTGDRFLEKVSQTRPETNEGHLALGPRKMLMNIIALILNPRLIVLFTS